MMIKEAYPHTVSGAYQSRDDATNIAERLIRKVGLGDAQVKLVEPGDVELPRKVEPNGKKIFRTMLSAHAWFAGIGLMSGLALGVLLAGYGPAFTQANPFFTVLATGWVGLLATSLLGGLTTLRPDRDRVIFNAREASRNGHWTVVAHCTDRSQHDSALALLRPRSLATHQTL